MALYTQLKPLLYYFLTQLENYNEGPFNRKIERYGFSVGFLYKDLCEEFNVKIITGIEECISGGDSKSKGKSFKGFTSMILNKGVRSNSRSMSEAYSPHNNFTISMLRDELYRIMKRMEALEQEINKQPKDELSKNKSAHAKLGFLTSKQWYKLGINNTKMFREIKGKLDKELIK